MKKSTIVMVLAIGMIFCLTLFSVQSFAGKEVISMVGEITAIDPIHKTVVIEVPIGKKGYGEQQFTVAGPLSSGAELVKGSHSATLEDFTVGDRVTVKWKTVKAGHLILSLQENPK